MWSDGGEESKGRKRGSLRLPIGPSGQSKSAGSQRPAARQRTAPTRRPRRALDSSPAAPNTPSPADNAIQPLLHPRTRKHLGATADAFSRASQLPHPFPSVGGAISQRRGGDPLGVVCALIAG